MRAEQSFKLINMWNRLTVVELRSRSLDIEANYLASEIKDIRGNIDSLIDPILLGEDVQATLNEIDGRVVKVEEKLSA